MGVEVEFAQNALPTTAIGMQRAFRTAGVRPSAKSVTPAELSTTTTNLIDSTANAAASAAADAAQAAAIAASNANATTLSASAQATAISVAAAALADHASDPNAHSQYLTQGEGDARYLRFPMTLTNAVDDAAAASAGVSVGNFYRNGSVVMIRLV